MVLKAVTHSIRTINSCFCRHDSVGSRRCYSTSISSLTSTSSSTAAAPTTYIDHWFDSIQKASTFYDEASNSQPRRYFYNVDLQGRLFLEETRPKNIATSIKDERFLSFFFGRVRPIADKQKTYLVEKSCHHDYPFVSLCGQEINYIRPAATPIVFHSIVMSKNNETDDRQNNHPSFDLIFGGDISIPFDFRSLAISKVNGRVYHPLVVTPLDGGHDDGDDDESAKLPPSKKIQKTNIWLQKLGYGLIRSSIAVSLSERIHHSETDDRFFYESDSGEHTSIEWLPSKFEPGSWAMPADVDEFES